MISAALTVAAAVCAVLAIAAESRPRRHRSFFALKPLTTILILALAAVEPASNVAPYKALVLAALALSLAGDVCLMFEGSRWFLGGLSSFFAAHLLFIVAFLSGLTYPQTPGWVLMVAIYVVLLGGWLYVRAGRLRVPVLAYCAVLLAMVVAAAVRNASLGSDSAELALAGALVFGVSDSALGIRKFGRAYRGAQALILTTYWLAIWLIAQSV